MSYQKLQGKQVASVTPSDTDNFQYDTQENRGAVLYVGTGGALRVLTANGDDVTFTNVANGSFIPIQCVRVYDTNTTASDILGIW